METPKDESKPDEESAERSAAPPKPGPEATPEAPEAAPPEAEQGGSYEDSWYQVLKRRAEDKPPADDQQSEK
jgi:hypothetical protein